MRPPKLEPFYAKKRSLIEALIPTGASVLDVGFWGQAVTRASSEWPHELLRARASELYGVDLSFDEAALPKKEQYQKASAEDFSFERRFDVVFASELIEHLTNPGLFLTRVKEHLADGGLLVLTTPNAFSAFPLVEKIIRPEPSVNPDHTMYFNAPVLTKLLQKCGFEVCAVTYLDSFHPRTGIRRLIRPFIWAVSRVTPKFLETVAIVARVKDAPQSAHV